MGVMQCKPHKSNQRTPELYNISSTSYTSDNYAKEIASYQQVVYHNSQPSHQLLHPLSCIDIKESESKRYSIQSKYANSISVLKKFWNINVNTLSNDEYSSLALKFYSNTVNGMPEAQDIFQSIKRDAATQSKIYFGMFGWLVSAITTLDSAHLLKKVSVLGKLHQKMGIKLSYYQKMGFAFHKTMTEYFNKEYTLRVRFCFNTLYEIVVDIMMGLDFHNKCTQQKDKMAAFIQHINDLMYCLDNDNALEYFELYMKQHFCGELALFYKDYKVYKLVNNDKERREKGKEMKKLYINKHSEREINIGYQQRNEFDDYLKKKGYDSGAFDSIAQDVIDLIRINCYPQFKSQIKKVYDENNVKKERKSASDSLSSKQNWNFLVNRINQSMSFDSV